MSENKKTAPINKVEECTKEIQTILTKYSCEITSEVVKVHLGKGLFADSALVRIIEKKESPILTK